MKTFEAFVQGMTAVVESRQYSRNQSTELSKDDEFELSKKSKLPVTMRASGYKFTSSVHAQARAVQRRDDMTEEDWKNFAKKIANYVETNKIRKGQFMFHDVKENQSVVAKVNGRNIDIITVYPKGTGGRVSNKQSGTTTQAMMEALTALYESAEMQAWLDEAFELIGEELTDVIVL